MSARRLDLEASLSLEAFQLEANLKLTLEGVTALFGPNGSGKSTLLRLIAGLEKAKRASIRYDEALWADSARGIHLPTHRRPVGLVFQDARLFEHLDVAGNLRYADRRSRKNGGAITWDGVIQALDLGQLLNRRVTGLSGGERQRVALGRTILTRPKLLLLDEPLSALDISRKADILPYLGSAPRQFGIPTIFVSHAVDEVVQIADRMIVLAEGRVQAVGSVAEVLERSDLQGFTGRFEAGSLLEAVVTRQDEEFRLTELSFAGQTITMPMVSFLSVGEAVRLRIRARDVALAKGRPQGLSIRNILEGEIAEISVEAGTAFAEVLIDLGGSRLRARITRASVADLDLKVGEQVFALVKSTTFDRRAISRRQ